MKKGRTVRLSSRRDGKTSTGHFRFGTYTEASVKAAEGSVVSLGKDFYMKHPDVGWVKGKKNGNGHEQVTYGAGQLWKYTSSAAYYKRVLKSSTTKWTWTGIERKINGVKAKQYKGTPKFDAADFSEYHVWLDAQYRPIRITSTATAYGMSVTTRDDFSKWGKKITIKAPKLG